MAIVIELGFLLWFALLTISLVAFVEAVQEARAKGHEAKARQVAGAPAYAPEPIQPHPVRTLAARLLHRPRLRLH